MSHVFIERAVDVCRSIPEWSEPHFSKSDCLIAVGMENESALSETNRRHVHRLLRGLEQAEGPPYHPNTEKDNTDHAVHLATLIAVNPATGKKASLAFVMRVAGFADESCGPGKDYVRVQRRVKTARQKNCNPPPPVPPPQASRAKPVPPKRPPSIPKYAAIMEIYLEDDSYAPNLLLSPLSSASSTTSSNNKKPAAKETAKNDDECFDFYNTPQVFDYSETMPPPFASPVSDLASCASAASKVSFKDAKQRPKNINSAISHLTTSQLHRRTTQAAQVERQTDRELDNIRKSMYKVGAVLYKSVTIKENTLQMFRSAEAVASELNNLVGIDILSGRELAEGVRKGRVNQSPPRLGRKGEIPDEVFKAFCTSIFTLCAIKQVNCHDRMNREQLKSAVGEVLNDMRKENGLDPMNDAKFYSRIEKEISHLQDLVPRVGEGKWWYLHMEDALSGSSAGPNSKARTCI
ncbi:hypothetical protein SEMRO_1560_G282560.1 [Seminavis robusta]|uniref:Uncharacterized protein n=1 Tax=Seminavis robusta TaxID=568900 RepID=A0A9N8EPX7_9STRA|nr:hypothetical protein SEMRO_1560_G282560.1 [Seminavis robusta]|eukprot:Sro1560_g282560.1 n/a (464) ;mRNA; f:24844-26235